MKKFLLPFALIPFLIIIAQNNHPKREFRAAWIATVANLDWPDSPHESVEDQKAELVRLLDQLKEAGINTVIFQVRNECDAMYDSPYEPWSYWLTGSQGMAPSPYYDPLKFAIKEAHKRGMEFHAWFNPYRAERHVGSHAMASNHVTRAHPDWVIQIGDFKFLDPGIPAVREYVTKVIMDVVARYDVDGVHFDDYFYPYPPNNITNQDDDTFARYSDGYTDRGDWRRHNVNLLVKMVHDSINAVKPWVKFGISPFGIWKPSNPPGISGMNAYSTIYCDALAWLNAKTVDYLAPQLYWKIGGAQDYSLLMPWWADHINGRHLYPGQALYRVSNGNFTASEIPRQIALNRANDKCEGSILFRAKNIPENPRGVTDSLKNNYYKYPALKPVMSWKDSIPPMAPGDPIFTRLEGSAIAGLQWANSPKASDGDSAWQYVVYNFYSNIGPQDFESAENIADVSPMNRFIPKRGNGEGPKYFAVSALDRLGNESAFTNLTQIPTPSIPVLAYPYDGADKLKDTIEIAWRYASGASFYDIQISSDASFSSVEYERTNLQDTALTITGLDGLTDYYWRVRSANAAGESVYSNSFVFTTGFPRTPQCIYPPDLTVNIPLQPTFKWYKAKGADNYHFQLAKSLLFNESSLVVDSVGLKDTTLTVAELEKSKIYFWRVKAINDVGESNWSSVFRFKTTATSGVVAENLTPDNFRLYPNYPNPFGSVNGSGNTTRIRFSIPAEGLVSLKIYDILGRKVAEIVNTRLAGGTYTFDFNAENLNSGIYIYVLNYKGKRLIGKMMFVK